MLNFLNLDLSFVKSNLAEVSFSSKDMIAKVVNTPKADHVTVPLTNKWLTKNEIESIAKSNLCLVKIFNYYNLPIKANVEELEKLKNGHLEKTRDTVNKIYSALPEELKKEVNIFNLQTAALFHDFGKVLIPNSVLNKGGKLNPQEREIMELHSQIGYELLKNRGLNEKVLNLIRYHHQNLRKSGYPAMENNFDYGIEYQILSVADKYTALREARCYKNPFGKYEAFEVIAKEVNSGLLSQEVYTALVKSV